MFLKVLLALAVWVLIIAAIAGAGLGQLTVFLAAGLLAAVVVVVAASGD